MMAPRTYQKSIFIVIATSTLFIYGGLKISRKSMDPQEYWNKVNTQKRHFHRTEGKRILGEILHRGAVKTNQKVVILLSNQRSGSSFVGDFFAHNYNVFYLFEPLHPYGMSCTQLQEERMRFLKNISRCDFKTLVEDYKRAFASSGTRSHEECLRNHVCYSHEQKEMLKRYSDLCETRRKTAFESGGQPLKISCSGNPVDLDIWSAMCRSSNIVAFKILRICSLQALEDLSKYLIHLGNEVYVIELVRDPRGIINSALSLELRPKGLDGRLEQVCSRFKSNMDYVEKQENHSGDGIVSGGRYIRVRYEDIADHPMIAVEKIYRFIGEIAPEEVLSWLEKATSGSRALVEELTQKLADKDLPSEEQIKLRKQISRVQWEEISPYGTTRNSSNIPMKWRKTLSMDVIRRIQEMCGDAMIRLGYKIIHSEEQKKDFSIKLW